VSTTDYATVVASSICSPSADPPFLNHAAILSIFLVIKHLSWFVEFLVFIEVFLFLVDFIRRHGWLDTGVTDEFDAVSVAVLSFIRMNAGLVKEAFGNIGIGVDSFDVESISIGGVGGHVEQRK
jgi:hypothetical protein